MRFWIFAAALMLIAPAAYADEIKIEPAKQKFGAPFTLSATIELKDDETLLFPEKIALPAEAQILSFQKSTPAPDGKGGVVHKITQSFVSYKTGEGIIAKIPYIVKKKDGTEEERALGPVKYETESLNPTEEAPDKIVAENPPAERGVVWTSYLAPLAIALGFIVLCYLLWRWLKKRKKNKKAAPEVEAPRLAPDDEAWRALTDLSNEDIFGKGERREHFFRVSAIMREYVERRFGVLAMERTTTEIKSEFGGKYTGEEARARLFTLLDLCDMIKFTKAEPTRDDADRAVKLGYEFVSLTRVISMEAQ